MKHTPGPWDVRITVSQHGEIVYRINAELRDLDEIAASPGHERYRANRRLIEAAPELLAALTRLAQLVEEGGIHDFIGDLTPDALAALADARAAIQKAEERSER